jgi:cell division septum initiation protein DivIVA
MRLSNDMNAGLSPQEKADIRKQIDELRKQITEALNHKTVQQTPPKATQSATQIVEEEDD